MRPLRWLALLGGFCLSACESTVGIELAVADTDGVESVQVKVESVQLIDADGGLHDLDADDVALDLRDSVDGSVAVLIAAAEIDDGTYTGLRLQFGEGPHTLQMSDGRVFELLRDSNVEYADLTLDIEEDESSEVVATLDLRFSLVADDDSGTYRLVPVLRAVDVVRGASISGALPTTAVSDTACRQGRDVGVGVAVYLYDDAAGAPADYRRGRSGPLASAPARPVEGAWGYAFDWLEPGSYALAWTCDADRDHPEQDDAMNFVSGSTVVVTVEAGAAVVLDMPEF